MYGFGFRNLSRSILAGGGGGANPLWDGLLAYWKADNTPNDATGNGNNLTAINGATYGTGIINQGFSYDGVNDSFDAGNILDFDGSTPFSFSFWVNPTTLGNKNIINKWTNSNTGYIIFLVGDKLRFALSNNISTDILRVETVSSLSLGMQHFTVSYDGSKSAEGITITRNGVIQSLTIINDTLTGSTSTTADFNLGKNTSNIGWYHGVIDEVACFGKNLTLAQSIELYNSGAGKQYPN